MKKIPLFLLKTALCQQIEKEKNLRDIYKPTVPRIDTRSVTNDDDEPGFFICNKKCDTCAHSVNTKFIQSPWDGRKWYIRQKINCTTKNVVYAIRCRLHPKAVYIGSTINLKTRWAGHKSDSKLNRSLKCAVAKHMKALEHPNDPQVNCLQIFAIEAVSDEEKLLSRETWWQCNLGTIFEGLNIRKDLQSMVKFQNRIQY